MKYLYAFRSASMCHAWVKFLFVINFPAKRTIYLESIYGIFKDYIEQIVTSGFLVLLS